MILPVKLSGHTMTPAGQIHPISMSQSWRTDGLSSCTITMRIDDEIQLALGDWVLVTSPHGHMSGVFYVKNVKTNYINQQVTITLEHTFGLLQEVVAFGEITPETIGGAGVTTTNINTAINYMLDFQTERLWNLHQNDYPDISQGWKFTHQDVYSALETIKDNVPDCQWEFDQSTLPWKVSLKAFPTTAIMEMRMSRNIESMVVTLDRSQMYTRVYPTGKKNLHIDSVNGGSSYLEKNTATWGVISQVLTDSTIDSAALLKNWAQTNLDKHSVPSVSVTVGGLDLSEATGEPLDALQIGRLCRIPLPEYGMTVTERIVELSWSNCIVSEDQVQVTLADELKTIQGVLYQLTKSGHHGKKANTSKDCDLEEHEEKIEEFDNSDIWVNRNSVWAVCGQYNVITDSDGNVHLQIKDGSFLEVERDGVYETVGTSQAITDLANTITGSALWTQRNNITGVVGEFDIVGTGANRRLVVKSGGGLNVRRNNVEYGLYDSGNLNAGVIVEKLSDGTTTTKIKSDYIDIAGIVTAEAINAALANASILTSGEITAGSVEATYGVSGATITGDTVNVTTAMNFVGDSIDKQTITIDGVEQTAKFLGTAPLSFSIADTQIYRTGVSAAGTLSEAWSKANQSDTYSTVYTVTSGTNQQKSITLTRNSPTWSTAPGVPGGMTYEIYAGGDTRMVIPVLGNVPYQQGLADAQAVTFQNPTYSGNTYDVSTRNLIEHLSNGATQTIPMRITRSAEWAGLDTNTPFTSAWLDTQDPGGSGWAARMRLVIYADEPYSEGYTKGLAEGYSPADDIMITVPQVYYHQTKPSGYTEIFTSRTVSTNKRWYAFRTYINGHSGDTKGYCFYVNV